MQNSDGMQKNACGVNETACTCACGINDTACTMHAVSLTPHAKYDTACTIDERFERPWQPLKGISIKDIYVLESSYPTTKKIFKLIKNLECGKDLMIKLKNKRVLVFA
jgi:hypothetical protein